LAMDPKTLGVVRGNLTARAKSKIVDEIAKDFTNHTVEHIERLLSED